MKKITLAAAIILSLASCAIFADKPPSPFHTDEGETSLTWSVANNTKNTTVISSSPSCPKQVSLSPSSHMQAIQTSILDGCILDKSNGANFKMTANGTTIANFRVYYTDGMVASGFNGAISTDKLSATYNNDILYLYDN